MKTSTDQTYHDKLGLLRGLFGPVVLLLLVNLHAEYLGVGDLKDALNLVAVEDVYQCLEGLKLFCLLQPAEYGKKVVYAERYNDTSPFSALS